MTPTPKPTKTPRPTPTGDRCVVPDLVGTKKNGATRKWQRAGFTGTLTAKDGNGTNYVIGTQSLPGGAKRPCAANITIGP
jgi:hypothetical protein